jgi:hypothetical protein
MATGVEHLLLLVARVAVGSIFVYVLGLITYVVGGYVVFIEMIELSYPFLDIDRDPRLNFLVAIAGIGMFIASLPLLLLATIFRHEGIDIVQIFLTTVLGAVGIALFRLTIFNVL